MNLEKVPVIIVDNLTDEQIRAYRIADNKTAEYSEWDYEKLIQEIQELSEANYDLELTGFDEDEFKSVVTVLNKIEYVPLQFVAEYIKGLGFDGIVFSSVTMENQYNYVIFNYDDINERNIINMNYREVDSVKYSTKTI